MKICKYIARNVLLILFLLVLGFFFTNALSLKKRVVSKSKAIKDKSQGITNRKVSKATVTKAKRSKSRKKKKRRAKVVSRQVSLSYQQIIEKQELAEGIVYKKIRFGKNNNFIIAHLIETNIEEYPNSIVVLKSKNIIDELDYPQNIFDDFQFDLSRIYDGELFAFVNANFWMAYLCYPIGPLVVDGEVLSMKRHKNWSSAFFDTGSRMYIDNFEILGQIYLANGQNFSIDNVNRRTSSDRIVLYNKYYGLELPKFKIIEIDKLVSQAIANFKSDTLATDSTDVAFDTVEFRRQLISEKQSESVESSTKKLVVQWIDPPLVNRLQRVRILSIETSAVKIPSDGYVITFLSDSFPKTAFRIGDTLNLLFQTNILRYIPFSNAVSGTPRLVRRGKARAEAYEEGSRGRRFIASQLARTAIGTNFSKTQIYLLVIEPPNSQNKNQGTSLSQLASIMKRIGAFDAINLDGGGSSVMFVSGKKVSPPIADNHRKISVVLGIFRLKNAKTSN